MAVLTIILLAVGTTLLGIGLYQITESQREARCFPTIYYWMIAATGLLILLAALIS